MPGLAGYVLNLTAHRHNFFVEYCSQDWAFKEPVLRSTLDNRLLVCFITLGGTHLTHVTSAKRGGHAGTGQRNLVLTNAIELCAPIALESLFASIPVELRHHVARRFRMEGLLTPRCFKAIEEAVCILVPGSAEAIRQLMDVGREKRFAALGAVERHALACQKQAVATSFALAALPLDPLKAYDPGDPANERAGGNPRSFLDGLTSVRLREDSMIEHDLRTLPGFERLKQVCGEAVSFASDHTRLTLVVANRRPLEETTGADLIYFNETHRSFVMVQYKAMDDGVYRPNQQFEDELERMRSLRTMLELHSAGSKIGDFRLNHDPFFLKFCPRIVLNPHDTGRTKGMYLPLEYWDRLSRDPQILGPRGGRALSYDNAGRYITETEFVNIVAKAWVGSSCEQSDLLELAVTTALETGRAVVIAIKTITVPTSEDGYDEVPLDPPSAMEPDLPF